MFFTWKRPKRLAFDKDMPDRQVGLSVNSIQPTSGVFAHLYWVTSVAASLAFKLLHADLWRPHALCSERMCKHKRAEK